MREQDLERMRREVEAAGGDAFGFLLTAKPWLKEIYKVAGKVSGVLGEEPHALISPLALPLYGVPHSWGEIVFAVRDLENAVQRLRAEGFGGAAPNMMDLGSNMMVRLAAGRLRWSEELVKRIFVRQGVRILSAEDYIVYILSSWSSPLGEEMAAKIIYANRNSLDRDYLLGISGDLRDKVEELLSMVNRL